MRVIGLPALEDNYIWVYFNKTNAVVVDPGESDQVVEYLNENNLYLDKIVLTHKHDDHVGGVEEILAAYPDEIDVLGPEECGDIVTQVLSDGDTFELLGDEFTAFSTPGHTEGHLSYLYGNILFCGDALFAAGCGRVFTGDYQAQFNTLKKFNGLSDSVMIFPGHEYTVTNLNFAKSVDSENIEVYDKSIKMAQEFLAEGYPSLPTSILDERRHNLFLTADTVEDFKKLRDQRDQF